MALALLYVGSLETLALREWSKLAPWPFSFSPGAPSRDLSCSLTEYRAFQVQQLCTLRSTACGEPTSAVGWSRWAGRPRPPTLSGSFRILRHSSSLLEPAMGQLWLPIRSVSKPPSMGHSHKNFYLLSCINDPIVLHCCLHRLF